MVSSAILFFLLRRGSAVGSVLPALPWWAVAWFAGSAVPGECGSGVGDAAQDGAVVQVGTDPDPDPAHDARIDRDLEGDRATVELGQPGAEAVRLGVAEHARHGHVGDLAVATLRGQ